MHVVLYQPEIPPNTGNVARLCAAANATLHLVGPLGFRLDDRELKRAGMDYWQHVRWHYWKDWNEFVAQVPVQGRLYLVETGGAQPYTAVHYQPGDYLVFGRETAGLPSPLLQAHAANVVHIPMYNPAARSINLSNAVAIVLYEALRQTSVQPAAGVTSS